MPVLEEIAQADGLVLGSPIYFGEVTGLMRAFLERLKGIIVMVLVPWNTVLHRHLASLNILLHTTPVR